MHNLFRHVWYMIVFVSTNSVSNDNSESYFDTILYFVWFFQWILCINDVNQSFLQINQIWVQFFNNVQW